MSLIVKVGVAARLGLVMPWKMPRHTQNYISESAASTCYSKQTKIWSDLGNVSRNEVKHDLNSIQ